MDYLYKSNIADFTDDGNEFFQLVDENEVIPFEECGLPIQARFCMIRAHESNDLLVQLGPYQTATYIPAGQLWSVDSIGNIDKIKVLKVIKSENDTTGDSKGRIQWMIGYGFANPDEIDTNLLIGPTGPMGVTGPTGAIGPTGPTGEKGNYLFPTFIIDSDMNLIEVFEDEYSTGDNFYLDQNGHLIWRIIQ